jgi:alpha-amylase
MKKTKLIVGAHGHTPFGSSEEEFERAYQTQYKPFIASLYRYPLVPVVLHFSGVLLSWLEQRHPEFFLILEELINRKQVEIIGGGFYEPMMPLIPLADRLGQIELLTTYLRKHFGKRPRGCWLPGLVWEQPLAATLQTCGIDYTFLESGQFLQAGLRECDLERPCLTEEQGKIITVFPISRRLTDALLCRDLGEVSRIVGEPSGDNRERVLTVFVEDLFDGNGGETAFCEFLDLVSGPNSPADLTIPSRVLKAGVPEAKAYFPSSAQEKVMYWAMDEEKRKLYDRISKVDADGAARAAAPYVAGSLPRQFLIRYPEANGIYTKMLYTHLLINQLRGDKYRKRSAREELWKAQGCDSFWHVNDGGLYRNRLRKAVYGALIEAEKITRERGVFIPSVIPVDINLDGDREFLIQGSDLNGYVRLRGGSLFEIDYLSRAWNYVDTMSRRKESYVDGDPILDESCRAVFSDRLLHPEVTLKDAAANRFADSRSCAKERYEELSLERAHLELTLRKAPDFTGPYGSIEIRKKYSMKKNQLTVFYTLANRGDRPERFNFAPEIDLSFAGEEPNFQRIGFCQEAAAESELKVAEYRGLECLTIEDVRNGLPIFLSSAGQFDVWVFPVRTRCRIDGIVADHYQSTCCMPVKPVILAPGEEWETRFSLRFGRQVSS